jgi:hypothetical protein
MSPSSGSSQAMTLDASGDLLVGVTSSGADGGVSISSTGYIQARIDNDTVAYFDRTGTGDDGEIIRLQQNGTTVGSIGTLSGRMAIGTGNTGLFFDSIRQVLTPHTMTGNTYSATIDLGRSAIPFKDAYLSGGVVFGPASASNVSSQTLDDYEEGTWTPTGVGVALGSASGTYTKVGRVVTVNWLFAYPTTSSGSQTYIANLPFSAGTSYANGGSHGYVNGSAAVSTSHITSTSTSLLFRTPNGGVLLTHADFSGAIVRGTYTYQTS